MTSKAPIVVIEDDDDDQFFIREAISSLEIENPLLFFLAMALRPWRI